MILDLDISIPVVLETYFLNGTHLVIDGKISDIDMVPVRIDNLSMLERRLNSFKLLTQNWDGYGADIVDSLAIANSKKFLLALPEHLVDSVKSEDITVTPYGTIVIDWHNGKGELVSTEVGNHTFGFFTEFNDNDSPKLERVNFNENSLPSELFSAFTKLLKD